MTRISWEKKIISFLFSLSFFFFYQETLLKILEHLENNQLPRKVLWDIKEVSPNLSLFIFLNVWACVFEHHDKIVSYDIIMKNCLFSWQLEVLNKHLLLTAKPVIYLVNMSEKDYTRKKNKWYVYFLVYLSNLHVFANFNFSTLLDLFFWLDGSTKGSWKSNKGKQLCPLPKIIFS